ANNGSLFLDEIGEMPLELQVKLLRAIQEGEIMRVGGSEVIKVNLRIISATNLDLFEEVRKGNFRKDLYYRLNVLPINIPPLREREKDIGLLFDYFIDEYNYSFTVKDEVKEGLMKYNWDGNIRELINCVMYLENLDKSPIGIEDLPFHIKTSLYNNIKDDRERSELKDEKHRIVLDILYKAFLEKEKLGRRSISQKAYENNHHISEYDVKGILDELNELDLVDISIGRGGTTISKKGI